jgi:hypothetical protein
MSSGPGSAQGSKGGKAPVGKARGKHPWWKLQPSEAKKLGATAVVLGTFSAVTSLVGLYTHNPTAVLAWSAGLTVIAVVAFVAINRGFKIKVGLSLPVLIGSLLVAILGGAVIGGTVGHVLRTAGPVRNQHSASPPSPSFSSGSTPSSSPRPVTDKVIFSDTFCTTVGDWTTGGGRTGGHYSRCALHVYANADDVESSEPRAHAVYPAAPAGVEIDVTAHRVAGSAEGDEYGVACRADGMGYAFIVQSDLAEIIRYSSTTGIIGSPLSKVPAKVGMNAHNRLQVTCANSGAGVYLALRVNGQQLTEVVDTNNPISSGTVGLFAATTPATQTPTEAEFENFKVTSLSGAATAPEGVITDPPAGATNVYYHEQLHVSGTAQNIPSGYHLDVFLQFVGDERYYAADDPNIAAPLINGHWSATIFIGEAKPIILWLVSLSPAEVNLVNGDVPDQTAGYPTLPGTRLASVSFTANASP